LKIRIKKREVMIWGNMIRKQGIVKKKKVLCQDDLNYMG
jgi:hypothetical protein